MNVELRIAALSTVLTVVTLIHGQNIEKNATNNKTENTIQNNKLLAPSPLEIVCNHTETCQRYDAIDELKYNDLKTRKCMCDEKCSTYGDCCKDSKYYNLTALHKRSFTCEKTFSDGYIYMINKCASDYANPTIIKYCETPSRTDLVENFIIGIPVAILEKNITYKNGYCAICNYEKELEFWNSKLYYEPDLDIILKNTSESFSSNKNSYSVAIHSPQQILFNMKMNENHTQLISVVEESSYLCKIVPKKILTLSSAARYCLPDSNLRPCSDCERSTSIDACTADSSVNNNNTLTLIWDDPHVPRVYTCDDIPYDVYARKKFCEPNIEHCFLRNAAKELCLVNSNFGPNQYTNIGNGAIYVEKYRAVFQREDYASTSVAGVIYICGSKISKSDEEESFEKLTIILTGILTKISILFLVIYLAINVNRKKLQSLPNKVLFSFCITLLLLYLTYAVIPLLESCSIAAAILHYLLLSCITWLLIASFDFWQVICLSSTKLQTLAGKTRLKRYLLYCFFGWISPCFIMAVAIYFELALNRIIPCNLKPGYGRLKQCFIAQTYPRRYFFLYPATIAFCIIIALFAHTSYQIYLSKRKNVKSTAQNNYYLLFLKLALSMGVTWTIALLVTYANSNIIDIVYVILNSSHGILMFFAYGFKRTMLTKVYEKHKDNSIVQQTRSTFLSIADKIKNPTSQSAASADSASQEMGRIG